MDIHNIYYTLLVDDEKAVSCCLPKTFFSPYFPAKNTTLTPSYLELPLFKDMPVPGGVNVPSTAMGHQQDTLPSYHGRNTNFCFKGIDTAEFDGIL